MTWLIAKIPYLGLAALLLALAASLLLHQRERAKTARLASELTLLRLEAEALKVERNAVARNLSALLDTAQLCEDSLRAAREDARARADLLARAKLRARTAAEKEKVVDDATRKAAVARLNRPLE